MVRTPATWHDCLARLQQEPRIALDIEANSLYAYWEQVCLIQVTIPGQDYIIDPLAELDLSGLGALIGDPAVEKVFHAAEYDLILLKGRYQWELENLFDTMWATRILGYPRYGLASILQDRYGLKLNKKYQKANWCKRPLSENKLAYAQTDTHYLLRLRDALYSELDEAGRLEEAREIFAEQSSVRPNGNNFKPDGFWSIRGVYEISPRQQAYVKGLYAYRDQQARKQDRPPFKIFDDKTLMALASAAPRYLSELYGVHGMTDGQIKRYGRGLLQTIREAQNAPTPRPPNRNNHRPPEEVVDRYERLHNWRKLRARARGVESDVILKRDTLWDLARVNPESTSELANISGLGPWRLDAYGDEVLELLRQGP
jgi:ribonuclease D